MRDGFLDVVDNGGNIVTGWRVTDCKTPRKTLDRRGSERRQVFSRTSNRPKASGSFSGNTDLMTTYVHLVSAVIRLAMQPEQLVDGQGEPSALTKT